MTILEALTLAKETGAKVRPVVGWQEFPYWHVVWDAVDGEWSKQWDDGMASVNLPMRVPVILGEWEVVDG